MFTIQEVIDYDYVIEYGRIIDIIIHYKDKNGINRSKNIETLIYYNYNNLRALHAYCNDLALEPGRFNEAYKLRIEIGNIQRRHNLW